MKEPYPKKWQPGEIRRWRLREREDFGLFGPVAEATEERFDPTRFWADDDPGRIPP